MSVLGPLLFPSVRQYSTYRCEYFIRKLLNLTYNARDSSVTVSTAFVLEKIMFFAVVSQFGCFLLRTGIHSSGINKCLSEALRVTKEKRRLESHHLHTTDLKSL